MYGFATAREHQSETSIRTVTRPFTVAVSGSNWWIKTYESAETIGETNFHWQTLSITNGLLAQCYYAPNVGQLFATLKSLVAPVACPDQVTQFIWLMLTPSLKAYASNLVSLPPVYTPSADVGTNPDLRRKCEVEYLDRSRLWLRQIRFFSDGTYNRHENGINSVGHYPKPYDEGFLEARFETLTLTNWNGLNVPLRVLGEIISPGGRPPNRFKTNTIVEIEVAGVLPLPAGFALPPRPTASLAVTDTRAPVAKDQMLGFRIHDGNWPTLEFSQQVVEEDKRKRRELGLPPR